MHGRVVCDQGHLVSQCRCINHKDDTIIAHSDKCGTVMAEPQNPAYAGYKPFYGVELHEIAKKALDEADKDKSEDILVAALRRIEVNTRMQLMNYLVRTPSARTDIAALVEATHAQAISDYHSLNFWTGNTGKASDVKHDSPEKIVGETA